MLFLGEKHDSKKVFTLRRGGPQVRVQHMPSKEYMWSPILIPCKRMPP